MPRSLRSAKNNEAVCKLKYDNFTQGDWTIMSDGHTVWLTKQKVGERCTDAIAIPKNIFDKLYDKYGKEQPPVRQR